MLIHFLKKSDFTRTGKRGILGVLKDSSNSVKRFYLNNFKDAYRQSAIDIVLCQDIAAEDEALVSRLIAFSPIITSQG